MTTLRRVHKTPSVTQKTYNSLERAITQNRLVPGQALVIGDLAEELGVSRTPVREALLMLEKARLVESSNGRMFVAGLTKNDLDEGFEFRETIELYCLEKVGRTDKARLTALRETLVINGELENPEVGAAADLQFHRSLVALAGNSRMLAAWDQTATQLQRFWQEGQTDLARVRSDIAECSAILDAVEARDLDTASKILKHHLAQTKASLSDWLEGKRTSS